MPRRSQQEIDQLIGELESSIAEGQAERSQEILEGLARDPRRLADAIVDRLVSGRETAPGFVLPLLEMVAEERAPTYLRRVADARQAPDTIRLAAQRMVGWPEGDQSRRRMKFLRSLQDGEAALIEDLRVADEYWPRANQAIADVVAYLAAFRSIDRRAFVRRVTGELGAGAYWLLSAALHLDDPGTQHLVIEEIERLGLTGAAGALDRAAKTARDPAVRQAAAEAAARLRVAPAQEPQPLPPITRALLSTVAMEGGQIALVMCELDAATTLMFGFWVSDDEGIRDASGFGSGPQEGLDRVEDVFDAEAIDLVDVDVAAVRGLLQESLEVNVTRELPLPPAFEVWEPLVHATYPPLPDEPVTVPSLSDLLPTGIRNLNRAAEELLDEPFFDRWAFEPDRVLAALSSIPQVTDEFREQEYAHVLERLLTPTTRDQLRRRLDHQAWLFEHDGEQRLRDVTLATAHSLRADDARRLARNPFWQSMVDRALVTVAESILQPPDLEP